MPKQQECVRIIHNTKNSYYESKLKCTRHIMRIIGFLVEWLRRLMAMFACHRIYLGNVL